MYYIGQFILFFTKTQFSNNSAFSLFEIKDVSYTKKIGEILKPKNY